MVAGSYSFITRSIAFLSSNSPAATMTFLSNPTEKKRESGTRSRTRQIGRALCESSSSTSHEPTKPLAPVAAGYYDGVPQSRGLAADGKYVYVAEKTDGLSIYSNDLATSVRTGTTVVPDHIALGQNYPNPFNPATTIAIELKEKALVTLEVYNYLGQRVATLMNGVVPAGMSTVSFDGTSLSSGVYLYRLQANGQTIAKKMTLLK